MKYEKYALFKSRTVTSENFNEETEELVFVKDVYLKLSEISDYRQKEEDVVIKGKRFSALTMDLTLKEEHLVLVDDVYYKINNRKIFRNKLILELTEKQEV